MTIDLSGFTASLPSPGTVSDIQAGYSGTVVGAVIGQYLVIGVPEAAAFAWVLVFGGGLCGFAAVRKVFDRHALL
jgi:hypothetical protein